MSLFSVVCRLFFALFAALFLGGCFQTGNSQGDDQRDPYFLSGKSHVNSMDWDGAITAFENALTSNPKSAAAHLELGVLYEERRTNYAAAIYHYERHLDLKPQSNMADTIKQRIFSCKVELAKSVSFAVVSREVQDELHKLTSTNALLNSQIVALKGDLVQQALVFSNRLAAAVQVSSPVPSSVPTEPERHQAWPEKQPTATAFPVAVRASSLPRSHAVRPGETLATIARKYNVKLSSLQAANPTVEAKRLRAGQILNLPFSHN